MDLDKKYQQLQRENSALQSQVQEKEQKLLKLRTGTYLIFGNHLLEYREFLVKISILFNLF